MKKEKLLITLAAISTFWISGCSMNSEVKHEPLPETISERDIELYQELKDNCCDIGEEKELARESLKNSIKRMVNLTNKNEERLELGDDRFTNVIRSYQRGEQDGI